MQKLKLYRSYGLPVDVYGLIYYKSAFTMRLAGKSTEDDEIFLQSQWLNNFKRIGSRADKAALLFDSLVEYFKPDLIVSIPSSDSKKKNEVTKLADKYNENPVKRHTNAAKSKYNETGKKNGTSIEPFNPDKLRWDWDTIRSAKKIMLFDDLSKSGQTMIDYSNYIKSNAPDVEIVCVVLALGWKLIQHIEPMVQGKADEYMREENRVHFDEIEVPDDFSFQLRKSTSKKSDDIAENEQRFLHTMEYAAPYVHNGRVVKKSKLLIDYMSFIREHGYTPTVSELAAFANVRRQDAADFIKTTSELTMRAASDAVRPLLKTMVLSVASRAIDRGDPAAAKFVAEIIRGDYEVQDGLDSSDPIEIIFKGKATPYALGRVDLPSNVMVVYDGRTSKWEVKQLVDGFIKKSLIITGQYTSQSDAWEEVKRVYGDAGGFVDDINCCIRFGG